MAVPRTGLGSPRVVVRVGESFLDLAAASAQAGSEYAGLLSHPSLDPFLAAGRAVWDDVRAEVRGWVTSTPQLEPLESVRLVMPFTVADYVDFYASEHHARRLGELLRPGLPALQANWRHQPVGYHGRAGTVVVSGTDVVRPRGQVGVDDGDDVRVEVRPTQRLDVEVELGFVVGVASRLGEPVAVDAFAEHVFGVVLVNDWSARDIQAWETVPLGPFLGKSFQTSISPWVVPLADLAAARCWPPSHADQGLASYLVETEPWGLDISLELRVNGELITTSPYAAMHWSPAQMLAHLTVNGASLRTGDLYASGTVSGPLDEQVGSLIERWRGERFLADGDEVTISATAPSGAGSRVDLGAVTGQVKPSLSAQP